jgi:hypothetical protein
MQSIVSISRTQRTQIQCVCTSDQERLHIRVNLLVGERAYGLVHVKMAVWARRFERGYPFGSRFTIESDDYPCNGIFIKRHANGYSMRGYDDRVGPARFTGDELVDILRVLETALPSAVKLLAAARAWVQK